jgi:uncharacterized protein (DUF58 family)
MADSDAAAARTTTAPGTAAARPAAEPGASPVHATAVRWTPGRRRADPRLPAYLVAGFGALVAAIATGQHELAALGAPFVALAAVGLLDRKPAGLRGSVELHAERAIEGDVIDGVATVEWEGEAEVDVVLADLRGVEAADPAPVAGWSLTPGRGPVSLPFRLRARSWGVHEVATLWVRVRRPGALLVWEQKLAAAPTLRILPTPLRLDRLLKPAEPRAVAGMHLSRSRGHGTDFAELRPYRPGDRMRDLSWATSARLGTPWVAVHHPERTGTVLLLLDAFVSDDAAGAEALARAARAAWAVASAHLHAQDRVGLLARGRTVAWLAPRGGRRARWQLLDELLAVGGAAAAYWRPRRRKGRVIVPTDALIVGITGLGWRWFVRDLLHHRRAGHATAALVIDTFDLLPKGDTRLDAAARRIWLAQRDAERHALDRGGVPTALVTGAAGVGPAISALRRRMGALHAGRPGVRVR